MVKISFPNAGDECKRGGDWFESIDGDKIDTGEYNSGYPLKLIEI